MSIRDTLSSTGAAQMKQYSNSDVMFFIDRVKFMAETWEIPPSYAGIPSGVIPHVGEPFLEKYGIMKRLLSDIGYQDMSMKTATKVESLLYYWAEIDIAVQEVWKKVECFVAPMLKKTVIDIDLLLRIP
ncbi:hypothetical protein GX51_06948 [Blastomyces parvus]|uniref:Uncharacterized protein n=1 Tax=Blastomyces parvus TaxID=2060905 RepID=A0A2B7WNT6_9EURO|nr:hypothetical protein GX51_06948 [Blastomyces parvus]